ncbi:MAG: DUF2851 family protein, partial [Saprospiraceae bacterium]
SSAWFLHTHDTDTHYSNVILHVVWQEDKPAVTQEGFRIPCVELAGRVDKTLLERYRLLMNNQEWVPCASSLPTVEKVIRSTWLERLMVERLESKTAYISSVFDRCARDWEQTFFVMLSRHLGSPANSDAMENLALKISLGILRKHGDRIDQIEAILFGVAGMLDKSVQHVYPLKLKQEFDFLKLKYGLNVIPSLQWKFMRMRPAHFPTIRIAQLAVIVSQHHHFISLLTEIVDVKKWNEIFSVCPAHGFWNDHYHFKSASPYAVKQLGKDTAASLIINLVAPFMFFYGKMQGIESLKTSALSILASLPPEKNAIIKGWKDYEWYAVDAGQTQAMIQLKKQYCDQRRCLHCAVGMRVLK